MRKQSKNVFFPLNTDFIKEQLKRHTSPFVKTYKWKSISPIISSVLLSHPFCCGCSFFFFFCKKSRIIIRKLGNLEEYKEKLNSIIGTDTQRENSC